MSLVTNFFIYSHVAVSRLPLLLKGVPFYHVHLLYKKIFISKQILVLSLLFFFQKDHVVIAVKDALSRYTPPVPEEYYKVLLTCNTFRCSQLITILQYIQYVLYYSTLTIILHMYSTLYWLYYNNTVDVFDAVMLSMLKLANVDQSPQKSDKSRTGLGLALHEGFWFFSRR